MEEEEFYDAFDPDLRQGYSSTVFEEVIIKENQDTNTLPLCIEIPEMPSPGAAEQNFPINPHQEMISENIESKVPFHSPILPETKPNVEDNALPDLDELTLDLTPFLTDNNLQNRPRLRSATRLGSFQPAIETIEESDVNVETESENPLPSQGLDPPDTRESFDQLSSDKDSSVPSVADTNSESSGKSSILSRFRKAVAVNFNVSPSKTPSENDYPLPKTPKNTPIASTIGGGGFFPNSFLFSSKAQTIYDRLKETQVLKYHQQAVWVTAFSLDGKYLATGGKDGRVVIWSVGIDRRGVSDQDITREGRSETITMDGETQNSYQSSAFPLLYPLPCRVYKDHTDDITDLSWTRRHFLLSASADKTVRLWNVKRAECLQRIDHPDVLTSVQFHPIRERFFVTGCFDGLVRVWDLIKEEKAELASAEHADLVTAVCFSPDGLYVAAGLMDGHVFLYETADLKYYTQIACIRKNKKLSSRDRRKVTSVTFIASRGYTTDPSIRRPATTTKDKYNLMVTTNDSRIRIFSMSDFTLILKLKGPLNSSRQIRASSSLDGKRIICGSDTGDVFIWKLPNHVDDKRHGSVDLTEDNAQQEKANSNPQQSVRSHATSAVECYVVPAQLKSTMRTPVLNSSTSTGAGAGTSGNTKEVYPPCTTTAFIPLNSIHLTHTALQAEDTTTSLRTMSKSSKYSSEDTTCMAILTAEYDGSLHVLYTSE